MKDYDRNGILIQSINRYAKYPINISGEERKWQPDMELTLNDGKIIFIEVTHNRHIEKKNIINSFSAILSVLGQKDNRILGGILCLLEANNDRYDIYTINNKSVNQNVRVFKQKLGDKDSEIAIFQVRLDVPMPQQLLEEAIGKYVVTNPYTQFLPDTQYDNGIRIIIKGINNLEFDVPQGA